MSAECEVVGKPLTRIDGVKRAKGALAMAST